MPEERKKGYSRPPMRESVVREMLRRYRNDFPLKASQPPEPIKVKKGYPANPPHNLRSMNQTKSLGLRRPVYIEMFGRWIEVESSKEFIKWIRIRDRRIAKMDRQRRQGKPYIID